MKHLILIITLLFFSTILFSQRYVEEIFDEVEIQEDIVYGENTTLTLTLLQIPIKTDLICDLYQPKNDDITDRPLIILVYDGIFLPPTFNGGCVGTRKDADVVEMAKRFARMGYVAACIDYRIGWDPINPAQDIRKFTYISAIWRGVQDLNTSIKFFRKTHEEDNNPYGINPEKVATIGFGTGAVITYGAATLDEDTDTWSNFVFPQGPMILNQINGDIAANTLGIAPANYTGFYEGDTISHINHVGYDHQAQLSIQFSGGIANTDWIDNDDTPLISFHTKNDIIYHCKNNLFFVPGAPIHLPVTNLSGACDILPIADELGINDVYNQYQYYDIYTNVANENNEGVDGLYIVYGDDSTGFNPWSYSYSEEPYNIEDSNCKTWTPEIQAVRDTCINYMIPRLCTTLKLPCLACFTSSNDEIRNDIELSIHPNPANQFVHFTTTEEPIIAIFLYDLQGKLISSYENLNDYHFHLEKGNLLSGIYLSKIRFENGYITKKIVFE